MDQIHLKFADQYRSHWVKVKFYKEKPELMGIKKVKGLRFCEAMRQAIVSPILLERSNVSCPGGRHAFGWGSESSQSSKDEVRMFNKRTLTPPLPQLSNGYNFIGLNTEGIPDLLLSYVLPQTAMDLIRKSCERNGNVFNTMLCTKMPICAGVAVRSYTEQKLALSFGSPESRQYADMGPNYVAVGIPRKLFQFYLDEDRS